MVLRKFLLIFCLFLFGCSVAKPKFTTEFPTEKIFTIKVDSQLTINERIQVVKAAHTWEEASHYNLKFIFVWDFVKSDDIISIANKSKFYEIYFLNLKNADRNILNFDEYIEGYYWPTNKNGKFILIFPEEFDYDVTHYYEVSLHEMGHLIGLIHSKYKYSIMAPTVLSYSLTKDDTNNLCEIVICNDK